MTIKDATLPSARSIIILSPITIRLRRKKTPGPFQSMCPAMTEGPSSPGVGDPVYQPAGNPFGGTSRLPSSSSPNLINDESTPMAGIKIRVGSERLITLTRGTEIDGADTSTDCWLVSPEAIARIAKTMSESITNRPALALVLFS